VQTATSETESKSLDLSICVHHYTLRAPCPKGQGIDDKTQCSQYDEAQWYTFSTMPLECRKLCILEIVAWCSVCCHEMAPGLRRFPSLCHVPLGGGPVINANREACGAILGGEASRVG